MRKEQRESLALTITDVQRLTAEEAALTSEAATEHNRWFDLHRRLEDLERTLSRKHERQGSAFDCRRCYRVRNCAKLRHVSVPAIISRTGTDAASSAPPQMYTGWTRRREMKS